MQSREAARLAVELMKIEERMRFVTGTAAERRTLALLAIDRYWGRLRHAVSDAADWPEVSADVARELALETIAPLRDK